MGIKRLSQQGKVEKYLISSYFRDRPQKLVFAAVGCCCVGLGGGAGAGGDLDDRGIGVPFGSDPDPEGRSFCGIGRGRSSGIGILLRCTVRLEGGL